MGHKPVTIKKLTAYILWIVAYMPVISLLILKYVDQNILPETLKAKINECFNKELLIYIILVLLTIIFYKISNIKSIEHMKTKAHANKTKLFIRSHDQISINEYSFFILSLLLPFLSHNTDNILDLLLALSVIVIIIIILVKKEQLIINPIFLFSKSNVFTAVIEINGTRKNVYIISIEESLDSDYPFIYFEYFKDIYYVELFTN